MTEQCTFCGRIGTTFDIIQGECKEAYNISTINVSPWIEINGEIAT